MPTYTDMEYQQHLHDENWSRQETDYLFEMCRRFDLRFVVICDRWDREQYPTRSVEDLKERYYNISNILTRVRFCYNRTNMLSHVSLMRFCSDEKNA